MFRYLHLGLLVALLALLTSCSGAPATTAPAATEQAPAVSATEESAVAVPATEQAPAAATEESSVAPPAASGGEIVVGLEGDIVAVDPAFNYDFTTSQVVNQIAEGLLKFENGSTLAPNLAESWENPDPLTYIYKIRQGVTFHDGSPMTMADVIFSMERHRNPDTASYVGWMYDKVDKIEPVDDWTLKVTLKEPDAFWRYVPATSAAHVISKAHFEANAENYGKPEAGAIGTGPFKFVSWSAGSEVVIERNDNYWNKANGGPYLDRITYKILPEATTRVAGLQTGELNMVVWALPADQLPVVQQMEKVNLTMSDSYMNDYISFNCQRPPFDNVKVRQALNYAVDKAQVVKTLQGEAALLGRAVPVGPRIWAFEKELWQEAYDALPAYEKDLEKAKQLLAESGVADQLNGKVITTDENPVRLGQALAFQAAAAEIGVQLEVSKVTFQENTTLEFSGERNYDILVNNWGADFPDPAGNLVPLFHSSNTGDGGANAQNYKNPDVDKLLDEQGKLIDQTERAKLMIQAEKLIAADSPMIMFDHPKMPMALDKAYTGYDMSPLWYWEAFMTNVRKVE